MKVAIIGAGHVGATLAYTLLVKGTVQTISIIDINEAKAAGEAEDLQHGLSFTDNATVLAEGYEGVRDADVVVVTAGRGRVPGESRLDLTRTNARLTGEILENIQKHGSGAILIMVSNPVDILTHMACTRLDIPRSRVIGSGTTLDSSRFRYLLGREFNIDPRSIHAHVIGEHGDSSVLAWSTASLGQMPVTDYVSAQRGRLSDADRQRIRASVVNAGKSVIQQKGATCYAIALSVARIIEAIARDEHSVFTVSSYIEDFHGIAGLCFSLPAVIGAEGIRELLPIQLSEQELAELRQSASTIQNVLREIAC